MSLCPQFIPIRKAKECLVVTNWRDSPSLKPRRSPQVSPLIAPLKSNNNDLRPPSKDSTCGKQLTPSSSLCRVALGDDFFVKIAVVVPQPPVIRSKGTEATGRLSEQEFQAFVSAQYTPGSAGFYNGARPPVRIYNVQAPVHIPLRAQSIITDDAPRVGVAAQSEHAITKEDSSTSTSSSTGHVAQRNDKAASTSEVSIHNDTSDLVVNAGDVLPEISLPPSVHVTYLATEPLLVAQFADADDAHYLVSRLDAWSNPQQGDSILPISLTPIQKECPSPWPMNAILSTEVVSRKRSLVNSTIVIKGLPFSTVCSTLVEQLNLMKYQPSYVRFHRGERGVFKCVAFVKYSSRVMAEHSRLELERMTVGGKALKVEYKKRLFLDVTSCKSNNASPVLSATTATTTRHRSNHSTNATGSPNHSPVLKHQDAEQLRQSTLSALENLVRDLRYSKEYEGFILPRTALTKDEFKYLKSLTAKFDFTFDVSPMIVVDRPQTQPVVSGTLQPPPPYTEHITIKRKVVLERQQQVSSHNQSPPPAPMTAAPSGKQVSPALRPTTPTWSTQTPGSLQPMDFRGIRHWKEIRTQQQQQQVSGGGGGTLLVVRPVAPGAVQPFSAGRGRRVVT